jgi:PAS domain S-box-containing protein
VELSQYVLEALRKDGEFVLYRGEHSNQPGSPSVLLLAPASMRPAPETLKKIEHEYSLRDELDSAWAVRPLALSEQRGQTTLVLEDPGGEPLDRFLPGPMEMTQFLHFAVGLATALGGLHKKELIHKDVKPANVLVNPATGQIRLMGFSIASRLPRERQAPEPPEFIAGTLPYMAPEQTGRMNRSIDSRSDLYALGVTLYEMLTGNLPLVASDPMELVHCHIARRPTPPCERLKGVPGAVSAITMKLLAKTAEERYQTAAGAASDLRRCLAEWQTQHRIDEFPLGEKDTPDRLLIPEKLYGRESEIAALLAAFERIVAGGGPELVLVSGYSGIGKSSVVNELHKPLVAPRGLFTSGKFDQYKRDIPYATLGQAFQSLLRPLLTQSEAELSKWRDAFRAALGPNGQLIVGLVPELKLIIGEQPPVPDLPPQDAQRRFQLVFRRFISVFPRPEHPLALFLDDLQWLDAATLDLLEDLLIQPDVQHVLLIGAYRKNEVNSSHPLMRKLDAIRKTGAPVQEIVLAPLTREDLTQLITDALHCEPERATPLAQLIHEKTAGNPFFAIQFISALAEEGLLTFDYGEGRWSWDLNSIRAKGYTDNVADLMVGKLNRLPIETQQALQLVACMGNSAEFDLLQMVSQQSNEEMHGQLWEAIRAGLIFRTEQSYRFLHDRVQEAAYSLIPEDRRAEAHLRIGRLLVAHTPAGKREEAIFEIVNQLNRGAALITIPDERDQLAKLNLIAGKRAMATTAYSTALTYLVAGMTQLIDHPWERRHDLIFALALNRAECEFLTGELSAAEERLIALSNRAATTVERARVACLHMDVCTTLGQIDRAVAICLDYLRHVGIEWSPHPTEDEARREYERIWSLLGGRPIEELIDLPLMSDPDSLATVDVLTKVGPPSLFTDSNLHSMVLCKAINLSLEHGNTDGSCVHYVGLSETAGPHFGDYEAGFRFGRLGYELVEQRGLRRFQPATYMVFGGIVLPWTKHVREGRDLVYRAFEVANKIGDLTYAAYSSHFIVTNLLTSGDPLGEVQRVAENSLTFAQNARFGFAGDIITGQLGLIRTLRGSTQRFGCFDDERFDERRFEGHLASHPGLALPECWYWVRKLQARFFCGDYAEAIDASSKAEKLLWTSPSELETADYHFYAALSRGAYCDGASAGERQQHLEFLAAHHRQLQVWAANCPQNFENRAALVAAEIARIEGRDLDAMRLYEQAIRSARASGFNHNEAIAYEVAGRFYAARGFDKTAGAYVLEARYGYLRWGAEGKVDQLDRQYPQLNQEKSVASSTSMIAASVEHLDLATVIKVSQAVSGELVLEKLIDRLMRTAIEHAGAERGLLIVPRGDELQMEAEATIGGEDVTVHLRDATHTPAALPESLVRYVMRTQETVMLDDASSQNPFSADPYIDQRRARSILSLPLINQGKLIGILYLENNLTPRVFTPDRVTVLKVLASQAAISLENTRLYRDLADREGKIRRLVDANILGIFIWNLEGAIVGANDAFLRMVQYDREDLVSGRVRWTDLTPAEWRERDERAVTELKGTGTVQPYEKEYFRKDGSRVPVLVGGALFQEGGNEGVAFVLDLSEQKRAEAVIREGERELQQMLDLAPQHVAVYGPNRERLYANRVSLDYLGFSLEEWQQSPGRGKYLHPDDNARLDGVFGHAVARGSADELELRLRKRDGTYRWFLARFNPLRDEQGQITRWYVAGTDIEDRKQAEDRLRRENVALREEIDKASMFEEIVGTSPALKSVLSRISKVAPSDSTVLITGETGTGKELVARAIHRRSDRASRAFVSVNCAAIPRDLIASELFGHEKGAFTGATQQRLGRFELANGGTIFLDEVGELPPETQIALLRVLQEHEFERIGGSRRIRADVRVIAATNRDLQAAISAGSFRSDLFYRLNVFPIEIPSLRERRADILLLVEYFIDRYARKAGKNIKRVSKKTLELIQSYPWPGNIRELQNVIERSVILCETEIFSIDESWLPKQPSLTEPKNQMELPRRLLAQEKEMIEAALKESHGRIFGPTGAAAKLGIPRSTLESKIRSLKIDKNRFRTSPEI